MNNKQTVRFIILLIIVVSIAIPLIFYFISFHGRLSNQAADWGYFSTFWIAFITLANTIAIITLTYYFQSAEATRATILDRPVVSISRNSGGTGYILSNIGKGAALNILCYCSSSPDFEQNKFTQKRICYSLKNGDSFAKDWLNGSLIIVEYTDIFNLTYFSMMQNDRFYIFNKNHEPLFQSNEKEIRKYTQFFKQYMQWDTSKPTWP
jgi:hypothetical protein